MQFNISDSLGLLNSSVAEAPLNLLAEVNNFREIMNPLSGGSNSGLDLINPMGNINPMDGNNLLQKAGILPKLDLDFTNSKGDSRTLMSRSLGKLV